MKNIITLKTNNKNIINFRANQEILDYIEKVKKEMGFMTISQAVRYIILKASRKNK